jgi:hypothetical protein
VHFVKLTSALPSTENNKELNSSHNNMHDQATKKFGEKDEIAYNFIEPNTLLATHKIS